MPQIYAAGPAPPAHGTCRVLQVDDAPLLIASGGPSELLRILQICVGADAEIVMRITELAGWKTCRLPD
jgi:phosphoserine phosphatase